MTDQQFTQKDLELVKDKTDDAADAKGGEAAAADTGGGDGKAADAKGDKAGSDKGGQKADDTDGGSAFDGLDDDSKGKAAGKQDGKSDDGQAADQSGKGDKEEGAEGKGADGETAEEKAERERVAAQWRERAAERILSPLKDKLTAKAFEKRQTAVLNQLKRFKSQEDALISGFSAMEKLRSGDHKKTPEGLSDEETAAWRKEQGIIATAEEYQPPKIEGIEWGDDDKPLIANFSKAAYEAGLTKEQADRMVKLKVDLDREVEVEYERKLKSTDRTDRETCHDQLRSEFGIAEFKPHMKIAERLLKDEEVFGGDEGYAMFVAARYYNPETGQWHRLTSNPAIMRGVIGLALERYGDGPMIAPDGKTGANANRAAEIEKIMNEDYDRYVREGLADELMAINRQKEAKAAKRASR